MYCAVLCCVLRGGATETEISTGEQKLAPRWPVTGGRMWWVLLGTERNRKTMFSCYLINRLSFKIEIMKRSIMYGADFLYYFMTYQKETEWTKQINFQKFIFVE